MMKLLVATTAVLAVLHVTALDNGLAKTPPRGFSTWNAWPDNRKPASGNSITEAQSRHYLQGIVAAGLNDLNYTYFIIDEPCFTGRDPVTGALVENKTTWPNGLKSFGAELRSHGMKLGIYTCVGPKTCGGCVASEGHEDQDMQTFADWGAEYVKVDSCSRNCTAAAGVPNATTCGQTLWTRFTSAIAKTGKPMVYSIIGNLDPGRGEQPWKWAVPFANSWRTNIDVQVGFQAVPYIVDAQRRMAGNGTWCPAPAGSVGHPCGGKGGPEQYSGPGHWNDMDMLMIGTQSVLFPRPLTVPEARSQMSMWTILKSPLLASADFNNVSKELLDILRNEEVLAVSDDALGLEGLRLEDQPNTQSVGECYVGKTEHGYAAVLFNRNFAPANFSLVLHDFLPPPAAPPAPAAAPAAAGGGRWKVRNLWTKSDVGTLASSDTFTATVPPFDSVMITLSPAA